MDRFEITAWREKAHRAVGYIERLNTIAAQRHDIGRVLKWTSAR
jgi:hypothetical protein